MPPVDVLTTMTTALPVFVEVIVLTAELAFCVNDPVPLPAVSASKREGETPAIERRVACSSGARSRLRQR